MEPKFPRPLLFFALLLFQAFSSSANTEIINLTPAIGPRISALDPVSSNWPVLTPVGAQNERRWSMIHVPQEGDPEGCAGKLEWCEDDLWLVLDFDAEEWSAYQSFTLRVSWPASHPFDFQLEAYTPYSYSLKAGHDVTRIADFPQTHPRTRQMYARIRPINTGVLAPWAQRAISLNQTHSQAMKDYGKVEFITILEPLRFGGIPETLLPTIAFLVPLTLLAGFMVFPQIHTCVAGIARDAEAELEEKRS